MACINSQTNCTVSGDEAAVDELQIMLREENVATTKLEVDVAYHSPHMKSISQQYLNAISTPIKDEPRLNRLVPMISSLTGSLISPESLNPNYWVENLVCPVNFSGAMESLLQHLQQRDESQEAKVVAMLVEVGPHSALRTPVIDSIKAGSVAEGRFKYTNLLRRHYPANLTYLEAIGELYQSGSLVNFSAVNDIPASASRLIDLLRYAWNHSQSYLAKSSLIDQYRFPKHARHDLLGSPVSGSGGSCWRNVVRVRENPWIAGHKINSSIIYPAAGYLAMAIEAARQMNASSKTVMSYELSDVSFVAALNIPEEDAAVEMLLEARPECFKTDRFSNSRIEFRISSINGEQDSKKLHCRGFIQASNASSGVDDDSMQHCDYAATAAACTTRVNSFYRALKAGGIEQGSYFQNLTNLYANRLHARASICVPDTASLMPSYFESDHLIHPIVLDTFLQLGFLAVIGSSASLSEGLIPRSLRRLRITTSPAFRKPGSQLAGYSSSQHVGIRSWEASISAGKTNADIPELIAEGLGICSLPIGKKIDYETEEKRQLCSEMLWVPDINFLPTSRVRGLISNSDSKRTDDEDLAMNLERYMDLYLPKVLDRWRTLNEEPKITGHFDLWLEWLTQRVNEATRRIATSHTKMSQASIRSEIQKTTAGRIWLEVAELIGGNFDTIMRGDVEPLQLLLRGDLLFSL
ncbi:Highly reducing polyketide synthase alt5 [Cladobotryum mycophilum]|uniref:Highly reducing polyketide synthase alt5 n=1 Tax=Cladobotryum mycophilum TaxID=491253 RepID=A0ABR0T574_9HYPO